MSEPQTASRVPPDPQVAKLRELADQRELVGGPAADEGEPPSNELPHDSDEPTSDSTLDEQDAGGQRHVRRDVQMLGRRSLERIEQIHLQNLQLIAERDRLRDELASAHKRAAEFEEVNLQLDQQIARLEAERMQLLELQQQLDRRDATVSELREQIRLREQEVRQHQQRSDEIQRQLRSIGRERSARVSVLKGQIRAAQQTNANLERQVEELVAYRQRAATCVHQVSHELRRVRSDNRMKARRLAEARSILQDIDRRLASEL
jgi:chromosome segregation ATPase